MKALDDDECYRALCARDRRFDGLFFVGVSTTGIYCRPICPARTAARSRCRFFVSAAAAEREGFRACFRCRPERAPGVAVVDAMPRIVESALAKIGAGELDRRSVDDVAADLGVSGRHLRRALEEATGVTPIELAQTRRLGLAKWLVQDTSLPLTRVAFASGFASVRRFNAAFAERFGCAPTEIRRGKPTQANVVTLRLEARAPFAGKEVFRFLRQRAMPGVEDVTDETYRRVVVLGDAVGYVDAALDPDRPGIVARVDDALLPHLSEILRRLRALFDLDARPDVIDPHLASDPRLRKHVARVPGIRVPGAFDGWELAARAVLGQQVSVRAATTLGGRLARTFGDSVAFASVEASTFPRAERLAEVRAEELARIGLPRARAETLVALARAVASGTIALETGVDFERTMTALSAIDGIGAWTTQYVAMRALRAPDAFLAGDLGVKKALGVSRLKDVEAIAARFRPWRAYALMHWWSALSSSE